MKKQKIYPKAWLDLHKRARQLDSDGWYISLANDLLGLLEGSRFLLPASCPHAAIVLALYMEDCIADGGDWRKFVRLHRQRYHRCLPFYNLSESYLDDEINPEDIALLLWMLQTDVVMGNGAVTDPHGAELLALANAAYAMLDRVFDKDRGIVASIDARTITTAKGEPLPCERPSRGWRAPIVDMLSVPEPRHGDDSVDIDDDGNKED